MSRPLRFPANYRARYYNATLQRFISEDPLGFGGGQINLYGYVGGRPVDQKDPGGTSLPHIHWLETFNAATAAGWSYSDAWDLAKAVVNVDFGPWPWATVQTDAANTHKHGMGGRYSESQKPESCGDAYQHILDEFNSWDLATQIHAIQDSYALGHLYQSGANGVGPMHVIQDFLYLPQAKAAVQQFLSPLILNPLGGPAGFLAPKPSNCN
jgi:hypothetical protein